MSFSRRNFSLVCLALFALSVPALADSFNDVHAKVYKDAPESRGALPQYSGLSGVDFFRALLNFGGDLVDRIRGTLAINEDFKARAPKLLHPMGVCADALWEIDGASPATGLLAQGTQVRAMVRFSTADGKTRYSAGDNRIFGFAVKLFPTSDETKSVETRNLFFLDQGGLDGDARARWLGPGTNDAPVYFRNAAPGSGFAGKVLTSIFKRFDWHPELRPVYPLTEIDGNGRTVAAPVTPTYVQLVPHGQGTFAWDFRDEILGYGAGEITFDVVLPKQDSVAEDTRIGRLTVGAPVVSTVCDQELHFHHHPSRR